MTTSDDNKAIKEVLCLFLEAFGNVTKFENYTGLVCWLTSYANTAPVVKMGDDSCVAKSISSVAYVVEHCAQRALNECKFGEPVLDWCRTLVTSCYAVSTVMEDLL